MLSVPFQRVTIDDPFWSPRLTQTASTSLLHQWQQLEASGCIDNFRVASGIKNGIHIGWFFADSDAYKWLDAVSRSHHLSLNPQVRVFADEFIVILQKTQQADGYLYTYNQILFPESRWQNLQIEHELYCHGHLIEAGISHFEATNSAALLNIALKAADLICQTFLGRGAIATPGHEEIEIALLKLAHLTDRPIYRQMASQFLEERGRQFAPIFAWRMLHENSRVNQRTKIHSNAIKGFQQLHPHLSPATQLPPPNHSDVPRGVKARFLLAGLVGTYFQQHLPIRSQSTPEGHAVRFVYLQTAIARLIAEKGDYTLLAPLQQRWMHMIEKRMYITGGIGTLPVAESFGHDYELPLASAYAETCAALGSMFWNWEMTQLSENAAYADLFERQLYNASLVGIGQNGISYLYNNPLENKNGLQRQPWFEIPCCPSNLARTWASLSGYVYTHNKNSLAIHQYIGSQIKLELEQPVTVEMNSTFPWQGRVELSVNPAQPFEFNLLLRFPSWCDSLQIELNGAEYPFIQPGVQSYPPTASGYDPRLARYVSIHRTWQASDVLRLNFSMPIQIQPAHHKVRTCRGKAAFSRGPLVYCLEAQDNPGVDIFHVEVDENSLQAQENGDLFGGITTLSAVSSSGSPLTFIPYAWWANRVDTRMTVYVRLRDSG